MTHTSSTNGIERDRIDALADRLKIDFPTVPDQVVEQTVADQYHALDGSPIRDFIPVLVEHNAKSALAEGCIH